MVRRSKEEEEAAHELRFFKIPSYLLKKASIAMTGFLPNGEKSESAVEFKNELEKLIEINSYDNPPKSDS